MVGHYGSFGEELAVRYDQEHQLYTPNAIEFVTGTDYFNEDPTPFHRVCLKTLYSLWGEFPPDTEEEELLHILHNNWSIDIPVVNCPRVNTLILPVGRRGKKSSFSVYVAGYEAYKLICKFNPQRYYGIRERHSIHIVHCAASGNQASEIFGLARDAIKRSLAFRSYVDFDKDNESELRLFTPYDRMINDQVDLRNSQVPRGKPKEPRLPGTVYIESITTSSRTSRGGAIIALLMTEMAYMQRAKRTAQGEILTDNSQSDYAVYTSLKPSTKDFGSDFIMVLESSAKEKGGEFYHQYCLAGGPEQDDRPVHSVPGAQVIQLATWEASPNITEESLYVEKLSDPIGYECEYGAHFGNPGAQAISEVAVVNAIVPGRVLSRVNAGRQTFEIAVDPGGKAKSKLGDTYAICWSHRVTTPDGRKKYIIDGLHGFRETIEQSHDGQAIIKAVNVREVMTFILDLVRDLGGRNWIDEIVYDQFESSEPIALLQSLGIPAIETTFTNTYKSQMYGAFLGLLQQGSVEFYEADNDNWMGMFRQEMKYLQRKTSGGLTYYTHPSSGPVQNDDFPDVVANCVYRMHLMDNMTVENRKEIMRGRHSPVTLQTITRPQLAPTAWGSRNPAAGRDFRRR